jgi:predicted small secreted protein
MFKRLSLILLLLAAVFSATAQNTIKGVIYDVANGEAIPFANIILDSTTMGAVTDLNGFFVIGRVPDGTYSLHVRYVGYDDHIETVVLKGGQTKKMNIQLSETSQTLKTLEVTSTRQAERRQSTQVSVEKISATQIQQMPSIGGQSDLAQYMQVLPGVNSTGDQGGQLYIRGGSMIQNLCLLDGMIVYNPFHSIGLYSIFETDVILNADIYTGGFGAEYGGRLSSVMDIKTRDGNKKRHSGKVGLNTFGASVILEGPLKKESNDNPSSITYLITAKNSYLSKSSKIFYPYVDGGLPYDFMDLYGKLTFSNGIGSKASFFGFRFDDQVNGYRAISDYHWRNYGAGANFVLVTGTSSNMDGTVAYSNYNINLDDVSGKPKYSSISGFNMNLGVTNFYPVGKVKYGLSMEGYQTQYRYTNEYNISRSQNENTTQLSAYATYHFEKGKWLIDPGFRLVYYASLSESSPEPRLAVKYNLTDKLHFKMAGGLYSQILLDARSDNDIVNLFNGFLTGSGNLNAPGTFLGNQVSGCVQKAQHLVLGVEYDFIDHLTLNVEAYVKNFSQLLNMNSHQYYDRTDPAYLPGGVYEKEPYYYTDFIYEKGRANGIDVSACYDIERLYLWFTYSLAWVTRTDEVQTYSPHYDRRHTINLLATYYMGKEKEWELSGRFSFGSGYPYTQTMGVYEDINFGGGIAGNYQQENGELGVVYGELYGGRLPCYHRLDIGAKRRFSLGNRCLLEVSLGATNVYSRQNIFYFDRLTYERINQLPFMWSLGMNFKF